MEINILFFTNSILMGFALAMDAFSVSVANALAEPDMKHRKMFAIAATFGGFQILMPLVGWCCVFVLSEIFELFDRAVPWIALILLGFLGIKMIVETVRQKNSGEAAAAVTAATLMLQGIATSIDALSVGFTIAGYTWFWAVIEALIIGAVTFGVCMGGLHIGRAVGSRLRHIAGIIGGAILICIGIEIFLTNIL